MPTRGARAGVSGRSLRVLPEQRAGGTRGDDRSGDDDARARRSRRLRRRRPRPARWRSRWRRAASSARCTRSGPNRSSARSASASTSSARGDPLWVTTIWSNTGSSAARMPSTSLSAITATTPTRNRKSNSSASAAASAAAPAGLCAASMNTVGALRIRSSRPGLVDGGEPGAHRVDVELTLARRHRRTPRPRPARPPRCAPDARRAAAGRSRSTPRRGPAVPAAARRPRSGGPAPRTPSPRGRPRRRRATACASSTSIASGTCRPMTATVSPGPDLRAALLMMPAFSAAISAMSSPRYSTWSTPIGVMTATGASTTLVASQRPPRPTSTTATSTGASANAANAIAVSDLELAHRRAAGRLATAASTICTNGSISR